jgi:surface polysaccharide O-acyltransferase-like enzyme
VGSEDTGSSKPRKYGIDAFRLLCVLSVIGNHAGKFDANTHVFVSLLSRWSVPFFFLVLGYFLGKKTGANRTSSAIQRIFLMFLVASILMIPLNLVRIGPAETLLYVSEHFLINGTYFHLWYLDSLLMGLLVIRLTDRSHRRRLLPVVAVITLLVSLLFSSYWTRDTAFFGRYLMVVPFLWFGMLLSSRMPSMRQSIALTLLGISIKALEGWVQHTQFNRELWECPFLIGTVPFAVGMFGIAANLGNSPVVESLGRLGGRYAGGMYITHVYFMALIGWGAGAIQVNQSTEYRSLVVPLVFLVNLAALRLIDRVAPSAIDVLLGDKFAICRWAHSLIVIPRSALQTARALAFSRIQ